MSYIRIWVHCVWSTKNRIPFLSDPIRVETISHILENAKLKGIYIDQINGFDEHLHTLISLGGKQNVSEIMQKIKGESSFWINKNRLTRFKFQWQDDFYAGSVGMPQLGHVRNYIQNQVQHHRKDSFENELERLIEEYNLEKILD
jgi:putative transposase